MKLPILYSKSYDIIFGGTEGSHPVGTRRYGRTFHYIRQELGITEQDIYEPYCVTDEELLMVHTEGYLNSLRQSETVARIAEFNFLASVPYGILQKKLLSPVRFAVGGTVRAGDLALAQGWAMNLSGGYHHAKADEGGGFCFFSDIAIAAERVLRNSEETGILVIDLDAHQGNGYASVFKGDPRIRILDVYNTDIYPHDEEAKQYIQFGYPVPSHTGDETYLALIREAIPPAIEKTSPDLILYIAGADIYEGDALGCMAVSELGIITRDEFVFRQAFMHGIPLLMVAGGGYADETATIMGRSIVNLLRNVIDLSS
jgi:histone deacetylase 11